MVSTVLGENILHQAQEVPVSAHSLNRLCLWRSRRTVSLTSYSTYCGISVLTSQVSQVFPRTACKTCEFRGADFKCAVLPWQRHLTLPQSFIFDLLKVTGISVHLDPKSESKTYLQSLVPNSVWSCIAHLIALDQGWFGIVTELISISVITQVITHDEFLW